MGSNSIDHSPDDDDHSWLAGHDRGIGAVAAAAVMVVWCYETEIA